MFLFSIVFLCLGIIFCKDKIIFFVFISLFCICLSFIRYEFSLPIKNNLNIVFYNEKKEEQEIKAVIDSEPDVRLDGVRYILRVKEIENNKEIQGKIYLKTGLYPRYNYGDELLLNCKLKTPEPVENFRYDKYLARYGVFSICQANNIKKISENKGNIFLQNIFQSKNIIAQKINKLWHEPDASFMAGLLYGYRGGLGTLNDKFSQTGVTHIVAISGYNISLISNILLNFFLYFSIPRKKSFYFVVLGVIIFVIFAGASASVVRAGIMGIIVLFAKQIGRKSQVANILILTALIMNVFNPYILVWDAGFQLSFLATIGLIYLSPVLNKYFIKVPEKFCLQENLVSTLSAIIITLPIILFQFGRLSIVAPFVNILILWILPWIMFLGFISVFFSFIFYPLADIFAWFAYAGMEYIIKIVSFFSELNFASVEFHFNLYCLVISYLILFYLMSKNKKYA
ncbi:MAG: ComEC/Rec2 family competence protein [Patescibacteria group bacterium]